MDDDNRVQPITNSFSNGYNVFLVTPLYDNIDLYKKVKAYLTSRIRKFERGIESRNKHRAGSLEYLQGEILFLQLQPLKKAEQTILEYLSEEEQVTWELL